jgi:hypothetical protein
MAVRRKPLSAKTLATLRAKAKKSKLFNLALFSFEGVKVRFFLRVQDLEYQCQLGQWLE